MAPSFFSLTSNRRGYVILSSIHHVVGKGMERLGCVDVEEARELKPPPPTRLPPFDYPIQHGQLFDPSFPRRFSFYLLLCSHRVTLRYCVLFTLNDRSWPMLSLC